MEWFIIFISYLVLVIVVTIEGQRRIIGTWPAFLLSLILSPLIGGIFVLLSRKKITFHHFIKLNDKQLKDIKLKNATHASKKDDWVELKTSELSIF